MENKANQDIRKALRIAGMKQWQLAEALGVCDNTLIYWLRRELPEEKKEKMLRIIEKWSAEHPA